MIKVLIVDDEQWNLNLIRKVGKWGKLGMEVVGEANDGIEAVQLLDTIKPQIVITDMRMPGVDGVGLLEVLNDCYPAIRSIVVSGYEDFTYTKHAIRYKAVDYLLKPIDEEELNCALSKCKAEIENAKEGNRTVAPNSEWSRSVALLKKQLSYHFNDLNASGIQRVLSQLEQKQLLFADGASGMTARLAEELHVLLLELLAENELKDERRQVLDEELVQHKSTPKMTVTAICDEYLSALERLIQRRKFKNKLNVEEVRQFIDRHFDEPLSRDRLSRLFYVSKVYISKTFKQRYGCNITDYVLKVRMTKARDWLVEERLSIKAVAEMSGYDDISYFHRVFKKHFGVAPGEMRKQDEV
ncbi:response regulator transcription factor [Paenibacillus kribbensis]|uniref:response regulator transcription factor n=1 Tax=Paenibacillus kribbensis TaxID=172713 RepID=UPI0008398227|nr:response regulator [Paenibacillus kribbensis]